jgi:hypothetical protein
MEDVAIFHQCIGKTANGKKCSAMTANDPPYAEHPTWPFLCPTCANAAPNKGSRNSNGIVLERPQLS